MAQGRSSGGGPFAGPSPRVAAQYSPRGQRLDGDRDVRIDGFAAGLQRNNVDLVAFERIEVVKGPSSMLYGQGSFGGFINLVRKKPQAEFGGSVTGVLGSYDTKRGEADDTGAFDKGGNVRGRLIMAHEDSGSFIDDVEYEVSVVAPSMEVLIGDNSRARLDLLYQEENYFPSLGIPIRIVGDEVQAPDIPRSFYFGVRTPDESTNRVSGATLQLDHQFNDRWLATLVLQINENDRLGLADSYGYGLYAGGNTYLYASRVEEQNNTWAGELRLSGAFDAFGREHQILFGVESNQRESLAQGGYAYVGTANVYGQNFEDAGTTSAINLPITYDFYNRSRNRAAYGQAQLSPLDRTKLLVGVRYDEVDQFSEDRIGGGSDDKEDHATTFRIGLTHDLTDLVVLCAFYAESFSPVSDTSRSGAILDPEEGTGYEAGVKTEWFDGALGANLAVF